MLLVEDNNLNQEVAVELLGEARLSVEVVENGEIAVRKVQENEYDIVLMDMQMPVMGGIEATQLIRRHEDTKGLPRLRIFAMTANVMPGDREACLAAGMDDYIAKPIKQSELAGKLRLVATTTAHDAPLEHQPSLDSARSS